MNRILIFGNSGSGKSTLAQRLGQNFCIPILDLDTIAWEPNQIAVRRSHTDAAKDLLEFIQNNNSWVIEGCYSSFIEIALAFATEIYFLNPGINKCLQNNSNRPWEPHKFKSSEEQTKAFEFLQNWIQEYETRNDEFGYSSHRALWNKFKGKKNELTE